MAFLETVLVARTNRQRAEPQISTDQELLAVGVASLAGGLTQSLPPAGGFSQSAVNLRSGARSQLSGLVTALLAVAVAMFLAPLLDDLPQAVLAAMVMVAILGLLDPRDFARYARIDRAELWVAVVVTGLCLTGGMLLGVGAGVALTLVLVLRQVNRPRIRPLYRRPGGGWTTIRPAGEEAGVAGTLLLHLDGSLYTGNAQVTVDAVVAAARDCGSSGAHRGARGFRRPPRDGADARRACAPSRKSSRPMASPSALAGIPPATLEVMRRDPWFVGAESAGLVFETVDDALAAAGRDHDASRWRHAGRSLTLERGEGA